MAQHPFLKSIRPVNLLSFGPETPEIELRPLNILIGPNGSGKSNFIEILALLSNLPDKEPWSTVIKTGGAREWVWKGSTSKHQASSITVRAGGEVYPTKVPSPRSGIDSSGMLTAAFSENGWAEKPLLYFISVREKEGSFEVLREQFQELDRSDSDPIRTPWFERDGWTGQIHGVDFPQDKGEKFPSLPPDRSVLSIPGRASYILPYVPKIQGFAEQVEGFAFYRDWVFGLGSTIRDLQPVGLDSYQLAADSSNLAQVLKAMRDRGDSSVFDRLIELLRTFYEPIKDVDTELVGTHLRIMIKEEGLSSRTPAERISDGTLRWLMLLIILLNPSPAPVTCIDEPELGLHPDIIPTLADLLRDASTRTQLILTTHSRTLVECFSDEPESVCVCSKFVRAKEI
jgi:predicted ATPase